MSNTPSATGEQSALTGYDWQYRNAARLTYDALLTRELQSIRLVDPDAGQLDDFIITRSGHTDAYQFKQSTQPGGLTFTNLTSSVGHPGDTRPRSLIADIAESWDSMQREVPDVHAHLVTNRPASTHDKLPGTRDNPTPRHFRAFLHEALVPLRDPEFDIDALDPKWGPAIAELQDVSGLEPQRFREFLASLRICTNADDRSEQGTTKRRRDLGWLKSVLMDAVVAASGKVELDAREVVQRAGWTGRFDLKLDHYFPVNLDTYAPLTEPLQQLERLLQRLDSGCIALTGPPGSGKSTLLSQALAIGSDTVLRYFAYVPGQITNRNAMTAQAFLQDICLRLEKGMPNDIDHLLPEGDLVALRDRFTRLLHQASERYESDGCRTVIVVDGLDHVQREQLGSESLLRELPPVSDLPDGVVFVIGSRTLTEMRPESRSWMQDNDTEINLAGHRLQHESMMGICSRAPSTRHLERSVHEQIAEMADGYPLALAYVLNYLSEDVGDAATRLNLLPLYEGDIGQYYEGIWSDYDDDSNALKFLSFVSRLRIAFDVQWVRDEFEESMLLKFRRGLAHLFSKEPDGYRFFHDSFRQFVSEKTASLYGGDDPIEGDRYSHRCLAQLLEDSQRQQYTYEAMYHRWQADQADRALGHATQPVFRQQIRNLRSPHLIKQDIALAAQIAAERGDALKLLELALSYLELNSRITSLSETGFPSLLLQTGEVAAAIAFCVNSDGKQLHTVFDIARRLGDQGDPAGRRLFDQAEARLFTERTQLFSANQSEILPDKYLRAATRFRPFARILAQLHEQREPKRPDHATSSYKDESENWSDYCNALQALIEESTRRDSHEDLITIADQCVEDISALANPDGDPDRMRFYTAWLQEAGVTAIRLLTEIQTDAIDHNALLNHPLMRVEPHTSQLTALIIAELLHKAQRIEPALHVLNLLNLNQQIAAADLGSDMREDTIHRQFRYWRLVYMCEEHFDELPVSNPPHSDTPGGNSVTAGAPLHSMHDRIRMASLVEGTLHEMARLQARMTLQDRFNDDEVSLTLRTCLKSIRFPHLQEPMDRWTATGVRRVFAPLIANAAIECGERVATSVAESFGHLFNSETRRWPLPLQQAIADEFEAAGIAIEWRDSVVERMRDDLGEQDVHGTLTTLENLARHYIEHDQIEAARSETDALLGRSLGVGYRKDYQFEAWGEWLATVAPQLDLDTATDQVSWLASLLKAVAPMCESLHPPGTHGVLRAAVLCEPMLAVRIFEYFVRNGLLQHSAALGALLVWLTKCTNPNDNRTARTALNAYLQMVVPVVGKPNEFMSPAPRSIVDRLDGTERQQAIAESTQVLETLAVPSSRRTWCKLLEIPESALQPHLLRTEHDDCDPTRWSSRRWDDTEPPSILPLKNGDHHSLDDLKNRPLNSAELLQLRTDEAANSRFEWAGIIKQSLASSDDIELLRPHFTDRNYRELPCRMIMAEAAYKYDDSLLTAGLCHEIFEQLSEEDWTDSRFDIGLRAISLLTALEGEDGSKTACRHLARRILSSDWSMPLILPNLLRILQTIEPDLDLPQTWELVRFHLEGIAHGLQIQARDTLRDHGTRWWIAKEPRDERAPAKNFNAETAIAELLVSHLGHPTWLLRDAAVRLTAQAIAGGSQHMTEALLRYGDSTTLPDALEGIGRCLAAIDELTSGAADSQLASLRSRLAQSDSLITRTLANGVARRNSRALPQRYNLTLPPPADDIGSDLSTLWAHHTMYEVISQNSVIPLSVLEAVAAIYYQEALGALPFPKETRNALERAAARMAHAQGRIWASRVAYGRILGDLVDAGIMPCPPEQAWYGFRFIDTEALLRVPVPRPPLVILPEHPSGYIQYDTWCEGTEASVDRLTNNVGQHAGHLIGAKSESHSLQHDQYDERIEITAARGTTPPTPSFETPAVGAALQDLANVDEVQEPDLGEPLISYSQALRFCQLSAAWLAFRPEVATALQWTPELNRYGTWLTQDGKRAVETVWWADGHKHVHHDATESYAAEGHAVILSTDGLSNIRRAFGPVSLHLTVSRGKQSNLEDSSRTIAHRVLHL